MIMSRLSILVSCLISICRTQTSVRFENLALRHQIAVYQQSISRLKLRPSDRFFWVCLSRLGSGWQQALAFVQPQTVIAWQKKRSDLEAEVNQLKHKIDKIATDKPWWQQITGTFADDPIYDEAMKRGRKYRESLRPKASTRSKK